LRRATGSVSPFSALQPSPFQPSLRSWVPGTTSSVSLRNQIDREDAVSEYRLHR